MSDSATHDGFSPLLVHLKVRGHSTLSVLCLWGSSCSLRATPLWLSWWADAQRHRRYVSTPLTMTSIRVGWNRRHVFLTHVTDLGCSLNRHGHLHQSFVSQQSLLKLVARALGWTGGGHSRLAMACRGAPTSQGATTPLVIVTRADDRRRWADCSPSSQPSLGAGDARRPTDTGDGQLSRQDGRRARAESLPPGDSRCSLDHRTETASRGASPPLSRSSCGRRLGRRSTRRRRGGKWRRRFRGSASCLRWLCRVSSEHWYRSGSRRSVFPPVDEEEEEGEASCFLTLPSPVFLHCRFTCWLLALFGWTSRHFSATPSVLTVLVLCLGVVWDCLFWLCILKSSEEYKKIGFPLYGLYFVQVYASAYGVFGLCFTLFPKWLSVLCCLKSTGSFRCTGWRHLENVSYSAFLDRQWLHMHLSVSRAEFRSFVNSKVDSHVGFCWELTWWKNIFSISGSTVVSRSWVSL